jgi:plastocyanin
MRLFPPGGSYRRVARAKISADAPTKVGAEGDNLKGVHVRKRLFSLLLLLLLVPAWAHAATTEVKVKDDFFDPRTVSPALGGTVHWADTATTISSHNVHEDGGIFHSGNVSSSINYSRTFSAGTYHYFCQAHGSPSGGMDGLVKVAPATSGSPTGLNFTVKWATGTTNTGTTFDVEYKVGSGAWKSWKSNTSLVKAVFGENSNPVKVQSNTKYTFRARSKKGTAASKLSPTKAFQT